MKKNKRLFIDLSILAVSIIGTILLAKFQVFSWLEAAVPNYLILAFIAGIFFISFFTVVPSGVMLINLVPDNNTIIIALVAGLGSVLGDLLIFSFIQDRLSSSLFSKLKIGSKLTGKWRDSKVMKIVLQVIGIAILASPLPNELGISLVGATKMKKRYFIPMSFVLNAISVYILLIAALALK